MTSQRADILFSAVLIIGLHTAAVAQRPARSGEFPSQDVVQYSLFERPGPSADSTIIDFLYRIPGNQFVLLRDASTGTFSSQGELLVEFRNTDGTHLRREIVPIRVERAAQVQRQEDLPDIQGRITFMLPKDEYRVSAEVKDQQSSQTYLDRTRRVDVGIPLDKPSFLNHPLFVYRDSGSASFIAFNRRGGVPFGSRGGVLFTVHAGGSISSSSLTWSLSPDLRSSQDPLSSYNGEGDPAVVLRGVRPVPGPIMRYEEVENGSEGFVTYFIPLPLEKLEPAIYSITLTLRDQSVERRVSFPVVWQSQPFSLGRFELAVDALRHIASEEDIDDMIGFMADNGRLRFNEFWRRRDPDTSTAYNEVEEEYYRRVDDAIRRFSTRGEFDGYKTDRGRILILFGTPSHTERVFKPDTGPREVWVYENLRKRFVFLDPSRTGEYELSQTDSL